MYLSCNSHHQCDDSRHGQNKEGREHKADDDEVTGLASGEISFPPLFRLHAHHGRQGAAEHLPERKVILILDVAGSSCRVVVHTIRIGLF